MDSALQARIHAITSLYSDFDNLPADVLHESSEARVKSPLEQVAADLSRSLSSGDAPHRVERAALEAKPGVSLVSATPAAAGKEQDAALNALHTVRGLLQATQQKGSYNADAAGSSSRVESHHPDGRAVHSAPSIAAATPSSSAHVLSSAQRGWLSPSPEKEGSSGVGVGVGGAPKGVSSPLALYATSSPRQVVAPRASSLSPSSPQDDVAMLSSLLAQVKGKAGSLEAAYMRVSPRLGPAVHAEGGGEGGVEGQGPPRLSSGLRVGVPLPSLQSTRGPSMGHGGTPTVPPALPPSPLDASAVRGGEGTIPGWASAVTMGMSYYPQLHGGGSKYGESPVQGTRPRSLSPGAGGLAGGRRAPPASPAPALAPEPEPEPERSTSTARAVRFAGVGSAFGGGGGRVQVGAGAVGVGAGRPARLPPTAPSSTAALEIDQGPLRAQDLQDVSSPAPRPGAPAVGGRGRGAGMGYGTEHASGGAEGEDLLGKAQRLHGLLPPSPMGRSDFAFSATGAGGAVSHASSIGPPPLPPAPGPSARSVSPRSPVRKHKAEMEGDLQSLEAAIEALEGQGAGYTRVGHVLASPQGAAGLLAKVGRRIGKVGAQRTPHAEAQADELQARSEAREAQQAERERAEEEESERRRQRVLAAREATVTASSSSSPAGRGGPLSTYSLLYEDDEEEVDLQEGEEEGSLGGRAGGQGEEEEDLTMDSNTAFHLDAAVIRRMLLPSAGQELPALYTPARIRALWSPAPLPVPASPAYDGPGRLPSLADQAIQHGWTPLPTGPHEGLPPFHTLDLAMGAGQAGVEGLCAWLEQLAGSQAALRADVRALQAATAAAAGELHPAEVHKYAQASESVLQSLIREAGEVVGEAASHGMRLVGAEWAVTSLARKQQEAAVQGRERIAAIVRRLEQRQIGLHLLQPALEARLASKRALLSTLHTGLRDVQVSLERCRGVAGRLDAQQAALAREEHVIRAGEASVGGEEWLTRVSEAAHLAMEQERQAVARRYGNLIAQAEEDAEATIAAAHAEGAARAAQLASAVEGEQGSSFDSAMAVLRSRVLAAQAQAEGTEARVMELDRQLAQARELRRLKGACRRLWATLPADRLAVALACDDETVEGMRKERAGATAAGGVGGEWKTAKKGKTGRLGVSPLVALGLSGPSSGAIPTVGAGKGERKGGSPPSSSSRTPTSSSASGVGQGKRGGSPTHSPSPTHPSGASSTTLAQEALAEARRMRGATRMSTSPSRPHTLLLQERLLRTYVPTLRVRAALCAWLAESLRAVPYSGEACSTLFAVACRVGHRQVSLLRAGKAVPPTLTLAAIAGVLQGEARVAGERERLARVLAQQEEGGAAGPSSPMHLPFPMSSLLPGTLLAHSPPPLTQQGAPTTRAQGRPVPDVPTLLPMLASPVGKAGTSPERVHQLLAEAAAGEVLRAPQPASPPLPMHADAREDEQDEEVDEADVRAEEAKVEAGRVTSSLLRHAASSTVRASLPTLVHATAGGVGAGLHSTLGLAMPYPAYSAQGQNGAAGFVF